MQRMVAPICAVCFVAASGHARADKFDISVDSGRKQRVHMYLSWNSKDCSPNKGVVKVLQKPQHGTLTPTQVDTVIKKNRFRRNDPCIGKPGNGFLVEYQSEAGYRGPDSFKIEATYGKRRGPVIDDYKITVK